MKFFGLEATPWDGGTLAGNMVLCGQRMGLYALADPMANNDATAWTQDGTGTVSYELGHTRVQRPGGSTGPLYYERQLYASGNRNWDIRCDSNAFIEAAGTDLPAKLSVQSSALTYRHWINKTHDFAGHQYEVVGHVPREKAALVANSPGTSPFATLRWTRTGDTYAAWSKHDGNTQGFVEIDSFTDSAVSTHHNANALDFGYRGDNQLATTVLQMRNLRDVYASDGDTGTWTSPVVDTIHGLRGFDWHQIDGDGIVSVEYRAANTSVGVSSSEWRTATNYLETTPSLSNRYVQVRVTITMTADGASPEVGPLMVVGTVTQDAMRLLRDNMLATNILVTRDRSDEGLWSQQVGSIQGGNESWARCIEAVADKIAADGDNFTWVDGDSVDLRRIVRYGAYRVIAENGGQLPIEVTGICRALIKAPSALATLTNGEKTTWNANIDGTISSATLVLNQIGERLSAKMAMNSLAAADPSFAWETYAETGGSDTLQAPYDAFFGSYWAGDGARDDEANPARPDKRFDWYSTHAMNSMIAATVLDPDYVNAATIIEDVKDHCRRLIQFTDHRGYSTSFVGRGVYGAMYIHGANAVMLAGVEFGNAKLIGHGRHMMTIGLRHFFRNAWHSAWGFVSSAASWDSHDLQQDAYDLAMATYEPHYTLTSAFRSIGLLAERAEAFAEDPIEFGDNAVEWDAFGAVAVGSSPRLSLLANHGVLKASFDSWSHVATYQQRALSSSFFENIGQPGGNKPAISGFAPTWRRGTDGSSDYITLTISGTPTTFAAGKCGFTRRSGTPRIYTGGTEPEIDGTTMTDMHWAIPDGARTRVVTLSRYACDEALAGCAIMTLPVPHQANETVGASVGADYAMVTGPDGRSAFLRTLTPDTCSGPTDDWRVGDADEQWNREKDRGRCAGVGDYSKTLGNTAYAAADGALSLAPMAPYQEATRLTDYVRSSDTVTFTVGDRKFWTDFDATVVADQNVNGTLFSGTVNGLMANTDGTEWGGGDGITAVKRGGITLLTTANGAAVSYTKTGTSVELNVGSGSGDVVLGRTLFGGATVAILATDPIADDVDITSSCTVTSSTVTIPSAVLTSNAQGSTSLAWTVPDTTIEQIAIDAATAATQATAAAADAAAAKTAAELARDLATADDKIEVEGGKLVRKQLAKGTATELTPTKTGKQLDGSDATSADDRVAAWIEE